MPLLVGLCLLNGAQLGWFLADISMGAQIARLRTVAEANLQQAEQKWMACHRNDVYTVGADVYRGCSRKSGFTTKQLDGLI